MSSTGILLRKFWSMIGLTEQKLITQVHVDIPT